MKDQRKTKAQLIAELETLRQSEERHRQLFESANDAIVSLTLDGMITTINRGAEVLLGWPREEQIGRHYREFLTPPSVTFTEERARRIPAGEKVSSIYEIELVHKDGSVVPVEGKSRFIRDREGKPIGYQTVFRDMTERKQAERALRTSQERQALILRSLPMAFYTAEAYGDSGAMWVSDQIDRISGFSPQRFVETPHFWASRLHPDDRERVLKANQTARDTGALVTEYRWQHADGTYHWFLDQATLIRDEAGAPKEVIGTWLDLTVRKRAEEALRESEERYRSLFENAYDGIALLTADGIITSANRGLEAMLGWSREEMIGQSYQKFHTPSSLITEESRVRRIQAREKAPSIAEIELARKDGSVVPIEARTRFIRNRDGKPMGVLAILRDITERKRSEEALRESEQRYRTISELISDYAYAVRIEPDYTYTVEWFTETFTRVTGFTFSKEPYSPNTWRIVHPEDVPIARKRRQKLMAGQRDVSEFRIIRKDGEVRWIREYGRPVWDETQGRVTHLYMAGHDITDRKRIEEALRDSEQRYRGLVESQQDLIVRVDPQGRFTFVNDAYCKKFAKQREELIGTSFIPLVHKDDQAATLEAMKGLAVPPYRVALEQRALTAEGWRWVAWEDYAIRNEHGKTVEIQAVGRDITDRKQAEEERQQLQAQLFQAQKLEAVGTLAGGVAHDFNNILAAILGFTELATDEMPEGTRAQHNLEEVLKASHRAKRLVQQILTLSRPNNQGYRPIQLHPIVEEVLTFLRALPTKAIAFHHSLDTLAAPVLADPTQIQQVLMNLCLNAVQAMEEKGGVLEVSLTRADVDGASALIPHNLKPGPHVRLTVRDTGCGMTPEVMQRIFDPFFTTKPVGQGSGLGLSIVHRIVTNHGGAITVESQLGQGTTFHVFLPLNEHVVWSENAPDQSSSLVGVNPENEKGEFSHVTHSGHRRRRTGAGRAAADAGEGRL